MHLKDFKFIIIGLVTCYSTVTLSQPPDENQLGAWYMYFYNYNFKESRWGVQGDFQYRDWRGIGDREQLLLRSGLTYVPKDSGIKFTLGFANITTGTFGRDIDNPSTENRMYQEALFSNTILSRFLLTHRFRYEQRWVENQDFRTRFRYNIFVNIPFNNKKLIKNTYYFAFYNEIFLNGERDIGNGQEVEYFDRNRTYLGFGYALIDKLRVQLGWMKQSTNNWQKGQLQFSLHQTL